MKVAGNPDVEVAGVELVFCNGCPGTWDKQLAAMLKAPGMLQQHELRGIDGLAL